MMPIKNTSVHYGLVAIVFHWFMALLIIILLGLGLYMVTLPIGLTKLKLFGWHKELGVLVLELVVLRLIWRLFNVVPVLPNYLPQWQRIAARFVHWIFYFLMFALPVTGWMLSSAANLPVSFFGLFVLPDFVAPSETLRLFLIDVHKWLAYIMIAVIGLHVAAALKHQFIHRDDILRRMFP